MTTKLIKFIILRPKEIPQNCEINVNCGEPIKNIKNILFSEDIKKELNVRFIYMGKILEDQKKLDDYIKCYQKDLLSKSESTLLNNIYKKGSQNVTNKNLNNKTLSNNSIDNNNSNNNNNNDNNNIPITIHVKITEKPASARYDNLDGKNLNTALAQLTLVMFVLLLWMYRYNYVDTFPIFLSVILLIFTFFIISIFFHTYIILLFQIIIHILVVFLQTLKHYFLRMCTYINEKKKKYLLRRQTRNSNTNTSTN
ncbi:conserved protein, unknown function [Hepatocystis sp. ex Piliocolobus tephrosceles]|nr:conserved protein, unknown function [Hepatocystis sp. ex Piliocolobus tephrosceles]